MRYIKEYLFKVRWAIIGVVAIAFMSHGAVLFSQSFGIDTDFIMNGEHNFDRIGRQGLIWIGLICITPRSSPLPLWYWRRFPLGFFCIGWGMEAAPVFLCWY